MDYTLSEARRLLATRVEADRLSEGELRKDIAAVLAQEEEMRTHAVGDWIRFMYQGHLVIDEIAYLVPRASWDSTIQAVTVAHGQVPLDSVLETRPAAVLAQEEK